MQLGVQDQGFRGICCPAVELFTKLQGITYCKTVILEKYSFWGNNDKKQLFTTS